MNESARFWIDSNNNKWSKVNYTKETAAKASASLVNCHKCIDCECCRNCSSCSSCNNCISSNKLLCCDDCAYCDDCIYCCFTAFRTNREGDYARQSRPENIASLVTSKPKE